MESSGKLDGRDYASEAGARQSAVGTINKSGPEPAGRDPDSPSDGSLDRGRSTPRPAAPAVAHDERHDERDQEQEEQDFCDSGGRAGKAGEAEDRRDDRDNEEPNRPAKHDSLQRLKGTTGGLQSACRAERGSASVEGVLERRGRWRGVGGGYCCRRLERGGGGRHGLSGRRGRRG